MAIPLAALGVMAGSSILGGILGRSKAKKMQRYTPEQRRMMSQMMERGGEAGKGLAEWGLTDPYEEAGPFEDRFKALYGDPMEQQYKSAISGLQATPERHSSARRQREMMATQQYMTGLGSRRQAMMEQDLAQKMGSKERALQRLQQRQMGLAQMGAGVTGTQQFDYQMQPSMLSRMGQGLSMGVGMAGAYQGLTGKGGLFEQKAGSPGIMSSLGSSIGRGYSNISSGIGSAANWLGDRWGGIGGSPTGETSLSR